MLERADSDKKVHWLATFPVRAGNGREKVGIEIACNVDCSVLLFFEKFRSRRRSWAPGGGRYLDGSPRSAKRVRHLAYPQLLVDQRVGKHEPFWFTSRLMA